MNTITSPYSEIIADVVPYLIIITSLIFLTLTTIKYVKLLLQDYDKE